MNTSDKALMAVIAAAAALLAVVGMLWRRDVRRLEEELRAEREARLSQPAVPAREGGADLPTGSEGQMESSRGGNSPGGAGDGPAPSGKPDYVPPVTKDPELAKFVNGELAAVERIPRDITSSIPTIRYEGDLAVIVSVLKDSKDNHAVRNEAANLLRRSGYGRLTDDLLEVLVNPEEEPRFRAFCVQHLWGNAGQAEPEERAKIVAFLHRALGDPDTTVRREALLALVGLGDPKGPETAVEWLVAQEAEKAEGIRDAAIRCVRDLDLRQHVPTIRRYLRDEDEVTRIAAIVTLGQWKDEESRSAFQEAAASKTVRLQRAGKEALKRLDQAAKTPSY